MKRTFAEGIADILLRDKAISEDTATTIKKEFAQRSKEQIDNFLLEEGLVDREDLLKALSEYYQVPAFDASGYFFRHMLVTQFPKDFLLRNVLIPVEVTSGDNILLVVASDPSDENLLPKIGEHVSYDLQFMVGIASDIRRQISTFYEDPVTVTDDYEDIPAEEDEEKKALEIAKRIYDRNK